MNSRLFGNFLVYMLFANYGGILSLSDVAAESLQQHAEKIRRSLDVELAQDDKVQWQRFDGKLRNQIQKAEKSGFRWVNGHSELLDDFYSVFARNMRTSARRFTERAFFAMC